PWRRWGDPPFARRSTRRGLGRGLWQRFCFHRATARRADQLSRRGGAGHIMKARPTNLQVCRFCIMDESEGGVRFDETGQCNCCREALARRPHEWWPDAEGAERMKRLVERLRAEGKGRRYDAMVGLSGGIDSA